MNEVWKPVKGYENLYEVSNCGRVRSTDHRTTVVQKNRTYNILRKGQLLTPKPRRHGYLAVPLYGRGGHSTRNMKVFSVHRLVAEAFVPNPDNLPEVNHKDEDKTNNRADNLEWMSHVDNTNYGTCQKRRAAKMVNGVKSRAIMQFTVDGKFIKEYPSVHEASRQLGFGIANIHHAAMHKQNGYAYGYVWRFSDTYA